MVWSFFWFLHIMELPDIIIAIRQHFAKKCQKSFISEGHVKIQIVPLFLNFPNAPWAQIWSLYLFHLFTTKFGKMCFVEYFDLE